MQNRMRKILLVYPDFQVNENIKEAYGNYSEGLAYISAVLKQEGHKVELYHMTWLPDESEYKKNLQKYKDVDIVGFSTRTTIFDNVRSFATWTREVMPDVFILCGGCHATLAPEETIRADNVDAICIGEGEYPLLELCNNLEDRKKIMEIQNLWIKTKDNIIVKNPVRPCIEELDSLPLPDYDLFDYANLVSSRLKTALVMVSRGCIFSCSYCSNSRFREIYPNHANYARFRSPDNSIDLLEQMLKKYPYIRYLNFRDAILNMKKHWFDEFIELYKEKIHLPFTCNLRLDLLNEEVVKKLAAAGCYMIDVGLESGDYGMRKDYLNRDMTDSQIVNSFKWFRKYSITSLTYNIIGLPHEDLGLALKTVKLNARIRPDRMIANIFTPFPMTRLTDIARECGFIDENTGFGNRVFLNQPQFPREQVLFIESYFRFFVKAYGLAWKLPAPLSRFLERLLGIIFTTPYKPHGFLVAVNDVRLSLTKNLKRQLINHNPKLYLQIRDSLIIKHGTE